jgi:hypothetical protein
MISHSLIERESDIFNPGLGPEAVVDETARELTKLASRLLKYLYLIPLYTVMARIFRLPFRAEILAASKALKGLANGIHKSTDGVTPSTSRRFVIHCVFTMNREREAS